jgi:hypothetical protein
MVDRMHAAAMDANDSKDSPRESPPDSRSRSVAPPHPGLTRVEIVCVVAAVVVLFAFVAGPIWRHPWTPNASILYSYIPIPFIVALVLLRGKRLAPGSWFVGTMQVAISKFMITAFALVGLWAATSPTPQPRDVPRSIAPPTSASTPEVTIVPHGAATPPARPAIDLTLGGATSASPAAIEVQVGAPLRLRSGDERMHTFVAPSLGLNVPLVPGETRTVVFAEPLGSIDVRCAVHPNEPHVTLDVVAAR